MRIACGIPKATNTHWEYVILIAFPVQQWLQEPASVLRYTHKIVCLVYLCPSFLHILFLLVSFVSFFFCIPLFLNSCFLLYHSSPHSFGWSMDCTTKQWGFRFQARTGSFPKRPVRLQAPFRFLGVCDDRATQSHPSLKVWGLISDPVFRCLQKKEFHFSHGTHYNSKDQLVQWLPNTHYWTIANS
jgi:hypothetical protein